MQTGRAFWRSQLTGVSVGFLEGVCYKNSVSLSFAPLVLGKRPGPVSEDEWWETSFAGVEPRAFVFICIKLAVAMHRGLWVNVHSSFICDNRNQKQASYHRHVNSKTVWLHTSPLQWALHSLGLGNGIRSDDSQESFAKLKSLGSLHILWSHWCISKWQYCR